MISLLAVILLALKPVHGYLTGDPPSFSSTTEPQDQYVFERDDAGDPVNLTFHCPVSGSDPLTITWYRGGVEDNVYQASNGSYVFPHIMQTDSRFADVDGVEYYCTATNFFGTIRSPTVRAFYAEPAMITESPEDVCDFLVGNNQLFTCSVAGSPAPTITFYYNGLLLQESDQVVIDGGTLTISSAGVEHFGMYQCVVENDGGAAVATWPFLVRTPVVPDITASFTVDPDPCLGYPLIQRDDVPVLLTVNLIADPCPTASWTLNGATVTTDTVGITIMDGCEDYVLGDTEFTFTLTVDEFKETTLGFYAVTFTNAVGSAPVLDTRVSNRVRADISAITAESSSPIVGTGENCLLADSEAKIVCENIAFPVAEVMFFKDGIAIDTSTERVTYDSCSTLTIMSVEEGDRGAYSCRADNDDTDQPEDISNTINLEYCMESAMVKDLTFSNNNPDEGEDIIATCEWTGSPTPEVTWLKDGVPLVEDRIRITVTNNNLLSELQIQDVQLDDTGPYTCSVSNNLGVDSQVRSLEVRMATTLFPSPTNTPGSGTGPTTTSPPTNGSGLSLSLSSFGVGIAVGLSVLGVFIVY